MNDREAASAATHQSRCHWFFRGVRASLALPALILASSFIGFAALAIEAGVTLTQAVFMTGMVWALPAKVVLIGAVMAGNQLPAAALAAGLSSIRLTPMVVAIVPELRGPGTRRWVLYLLSHFVAVTSWVLAMARLPEVPREMRTTFYGGLGSTLVLLNMGVVVAVYLLARDLPVVVSAALFLLTPMYFLTSLWGSARERAGHHAMLFGLALGPLFRIATPGYELVGAGFVGGLAAYAVHRWRKRKRPQ